MNHINDIEETLSHALIIRDELGCPFSLNAFPRKVKILSRFMVTPRRILLA
jgi:hypothetical protein